MPSETPHPTHQNEIDSFLSPKRDMTLDMLSILTFSEIGRRDNIIDIGCGPGYLHSNWPRLLLMGSYTL